MRFLHLIIRNILRRPARTALTGFGIAAGIIIFAGLLSLDHGVKRMVETTGGDLVITVFERYKACPPYSRMPVHYREKIAAVPHVKEVMPVRFLLSNCQTTTDLVAVHGVEPARLRHFRKLDLPEEQYSAFEGERGAAIVGRAIAEKYGWQVGDQVTLKELRGISFTVRGIFRSPGSSLESVILVDREYLEFAIQEVGITTMFLVLVDGPEHVDQASFQIDSEFANSQTQTKSGPEKAFIAGSIEDFKDMVEFAQVVAYLALLLVLAAIANSVSMSVRDRLREMAILKTLGFRRARVVRLVLAEALVVSVAAAAVGCGIAALILNTGRLSISVEGYTIAPHLSVQIAALSLLAGALLGLVGAYFSARRGARLPIVTALREVD